MKQQLRAIACRFAGLELVLILLGVAPVLLFDAWMPAWAIAAVLAAVPVLWLLRWVGQGYLTRPTPLEVPILLLLSMVLVGLWVAPMKMVTLPHVYRIILGFALFYAMVNTLHAARHLHIGTMLVLAAIAAMGGLALVGTQWSTGKFSLPFMDAIYARLPALVGPFWNPAGLGPNSVGGILAMLSPLAVAYAVGARRWWMKMASALVALVGCLAVVLSQSRGGILALFVALLVMGVARSRWFLIVVLLVGLVSLQVIGLTGIEFMFDGPDSSVALETAAGSLEWRLELWSRALYLGQDFPVTGVGLGMFGRAVNLLYPMPELPPEIPYYHPHNVYLAHLVDGGFPGLVAFVALLLLLFAIAVRSIRLSRQGEWWPLAIGLLGALAAFAVHGLFDSITSYIRAHIVLWGLVGLQTALWLYLGGQKTSSGLGS